MIVRELLTKIGYKVDKGTEDKANQSFERVKGWARELGLVLGAGAVVLGFKRMVDAASDVEETLNVVSTAFGDNAQSVLDWAKTHAEAAGRSEYQLRSYAAALGQVVAPTLQNDKATADLSTSLAALTVDMASFNNETEADTLGALRSGLIGSYEPLQRFGVVMNVATLETFAAAKGIRKKMKDMSEAEKVQLRYNFIMERTAKQQGDAIRTAGGYANMVKRLEGTLLDLQVNLGKLFLPAMTAVVEALASATKAVGEFVYENKVPLMAAVNAVGNALNWAKLILVGFYEASGWAKIAMIGLAVALSMVLGVSKKVLITQTLLLAKFILIGAVIAGVILILDDLWKAFTTGEGVLAGFFGEFKAVADESDSYAVAIGRMLTNALDFWIEYFGGLRGAASGTIDEILNTFQPLFDWWYEWVGLPGEIFGIIASGIDVFIADSYRVFAAWYQSIWNGLALAVDGWLLEFDRYWTDLVVTLEGIGQDVMSILGDAWAAVTAFVQARIDFWRGLFEGLASDVASVFEGIAATIKGAIDNIVGWFADKLEPIIDEIRTAAEFWGNAFGGVTKFVGEVATDIGEAIGAIDAETAGPGGQVIAAAAAPPPMIGGPEIILPPPAAGRAGGDVNANQNIEVNVSAPGGDGPGIAAAVAPAVGRAAADGNRRTAQQLLLGGVTP
jgi:hypothetical protein